MNRVFVDTSAILALLVEGDRAHRSAVDAFDTLSRQAAVLVTTSYVLVETYALVSRRLGLPAVASVREEFAPLLEVIWVAAPLHERGLDELLLRDTASLSLVDVVSFLVAREQEIDEVFAFDRHFELEGFRLVG